MTEEKLAEIAKAAADATVPEDADGFTFEKWFIARDAVLFAASDLLPTPAANEVPVDQEPEGLTENPIGKYFNDTTIDYSQLPGQPVNLTINPIDYNPLVIVRGGKELLRLKADGKLIIDESNTEQAAQAFVEHVKSLCEAFGGFNYLARKRNEALKCFLMLSISKAARNKLPNAPLGADVFRLACEYQNILTGEHIASSIPEAVFQELIDEFGLRGMFEASTHISDEGE